MATERSIDVGKSSQEQAPAARAAFFLAKGLAKALREYSMLAAGDRVAVGVSGGKDSLALLSLLAWWRARAAEPFDLLALHFPVTGMGPVAVPPGLAEWVRGLGVELVVLEPPAESWPVDCRRCAALRRRALLEGAARHGCRRLALGHHADDLAVTTLLNLVKHGRLDTMAPKRQYGPVTLIRPLIYIPERNLARYARLAALPVHPTPCPLAADTDRAKAAELLRLALGISRQARINLARAALRAKYPGE